MSVTDRPARLPGGVDQLHEHLRQIFADRLEAFVVYGPHAVPGPDDGKKTTIRGSVTTLALVSSIRFSDVSACAARAERWHDLGLTVPLLLTRNEFVRSLDAFPLEYGEIISHHIVVAGTDPFDGLRIEPADRRRACEVEAKSHLIHLREGYIETSEQPAAIAALIVASAEPFRRLVVNVALLQGLSSASADELAAMLSARADLTPDVVVQVLRVALTGELSASDAILLYPAYLENVERLWQFVDSWKA